MLNYLKLVSLINKGFLQNVSVKYTVDRALGAQLLPYNGNSPHYWMHYTEKGLKLYPEPQEGDVITITWERKWWQFWKKNRTVKYTANNSVYGEESHD